MAAGYIGLYIFSDCGIWICQVGFDFGMSTERQHKTSILVRTIRGSYKTREGGGLIMVNTTSASETLSAPMIPTSLANNVSLIREHHPRIFEKITQLWGSVELHNYLDSIIFDERGGRKGFPEPISAALFRIYETHGDLIKIPKNGDVWDAILTQVKTPGSGPDK